MQPHATTLNQRGEKGSHAAAPIRRPTKTFPTRFSGIDDDTEDNNPFRDLLSAGVGAVESKSIHSSSRRVGLAKSMKSKSDSKSVARRRRGVGGAVLDKSKRGAVNELEMQTPPAHARISSSALRVLAPETPVDDEEQDERSGTSKGAKRLREEDSSSSSSRSAGLRRTRIEISTPDHTHAELEPSSPASEEQQGHQSSLRSVSTSIATPHMDEDEPSIPEVVYMTKDHKNEHQSQTQTQSSHTYSSSQSQSQSIYLATTYSQDDSEAAAERARSLVKTHNDDYDEGWVSVKPVVIRDMNPTGECFRWKCPPPSRDQVKEYARVFEMVEEEVD